MTTNSLLVLQNVDRRERRGVMAALDLSQCLVWFDPYGNIVDANPNISNLLGYTLDQLKGMNHAVLIGEPDLSAPHYQRMWDRIRDGHQKNDERSIYDSHGTEIWSSLSYAAIKNDKGQTRRVLAIVIDLSPWSWRPKEPLPS